MPRRVGYHLGGMAEPGATRILEPPSSGRIHRGSVPVTIADVDPMARCRLDAIMRFCQNVARSDWMDSGVGGSMAWLARRILCEVPRWPRLDEGLELTTWCSGFGGRWAERRTTLVGDSGGRVETVALWVQVDATTGRPAKLGDGFFGVWGESAGTRRVSARMQLPGEPSAEAVAVPWPVRLADLDVIGHINNASQCEAFEEALALAGGVAGAVRAEVEFGGSLDRGSSPVLWWVAAGGGVDAWLVGDGETATASRIRPLQDRPAG